MDSHDRVARQGWYQRHFSRRKLFAGAEAVSAGAVVGSQSPTVAHAADGEQYGTGVSGTRQNKSTFESHRENVQPRPWRRSRLARARRVVPPPPPPASATTRSPRWPRCQQPPPPICNVACGRPRSSRPAPGEALLPAPFLFLCSVRHGRQKLGDARVRGAPPPAAGRPALVDEVADLVGQPLGRMRSSRIESASDAAARRAARATSASESQNGWTGSRRWPMTSAGRVERAPLGLRRRDAAEEQALQDGGADGAGSWRIVSSPSRPAAARRRAGPARAARATRRMTGSPKVSATISGVKAIAQPSSALSSTGISTTMPRTRSGASSAGLQRRVGAQRGAGDDGLVDLEVVEQRDDLLAEAAASSSASCRAGGPTGRGRAGRASPRGCRARPARARAAACILLRQQQAVDQDAASAGPRRSSCRRGGCLRGGRGACGRRIVGGQTGQPSANPRARRASCVECHRCSRQADTAGMEAPPPQPPACAPRARACAACLAALRRRASSHASARGDERAFEVGLRPLSPRDARLLPAHARLPRGGRGRRSSTPSSPAYRALRADDRAIHLKAWLYTIARNRCLSVLRARREQVALDEVDGRARRALAAEVERARGPARAAGATSTACPTTSARRSCSSSSATTPTTRSPRSSACGARR